MGGRLSRTFTRAGLHVFTHQAYESRIRGGHNFYQVRVLDQRVTSNLDTLDVLVALDRVSVDLDHGNLGENGIITYDSSSLEKSFMGDEFIDIPFVGPAREKGGSPIMANTVATGAELGLPGMEIDILAGLLTEKGLRPHRPVKGVRDRAQFWQGNTHRHHLQKRSPGHGRSH